MYLSIVIGSRSLTTMANLDLEDFLILKEIYRTRSITASVEQIGLSQPSISIRLNHLRRHFGDALFVRTAEGMMPTPLLEKLLPRIDVASELLSPPGTETADFDPTSSSRTFRISLAHVAQMTLFPELLTLLEKQAPNVRTESMELDRETGSLLESGQVDVAIGFAIELNRGFYQQRLITEHYVCIARHDHPRIRASLSKEQFLAESYVETVAPATGHSLLNKALEERGIERTIKVRVSSLLGMEKIVASTELVAIVPSRLGRTLAQGGRIKLLKIPVPIPSYEVRQYWHERYHQEPGNRWLRQFIFDAFLDMPMP